MAKNVGFNINLSVNGKEVVMQCKRGVEDLGRALGTIPSGASAAGNALRAMGAVASTLQSLQSSITGIMGVMKEMTDAYAVQEEAELKLQTVMKQRMNATSADVDGIKELASAQQALGVVGDEVQLAGAQQVATFLNEKSSIEKLLPAMNNLAVQRKGLNVTAEDMVNIGNMMGKVMQGQTSALRRVGITFTDAQEKVLKYGNESERAAMLAQVITDNVGNMNAELAKTDAGKAKQMANNFGDMQENIGKTLAKWEPLMRQFAQIGIITSSVGMLGNSLLGTVKALAAFTGGAKMAAFNTKMATGAVNLFTSAMGMSAVSVTAGARAVRVLTWAIRGLEVATVIGAVIVALSVAFEQLGFSAGTAEGEMKKSKTAAEAMNEAAEAGQEAYKNAAAGIGENIAKLQGLMDKQRKGVDVSKDEKKIVGELNTAYGERMGYFKTVQEWYQALTANSETYCRQLVAEAEAQKLSQQIAEKMQEAHNVRYDEKGGVRRYSNRRETEKVATGQVNTGDKILPTYEYREKVGSSDVEKAQKQYDDALAEAKALQERLNKTVNTAQGATYKVKGAPTAPEEKTQSTRPTRSTRVTRTDKGDIKKEWGLTDIRGEVAAVYDEMDKRAREHQALVRDEFGSYAELDETLRVLQDRQQTAGVGERKNLQERIDKLQEVRAMMEAVDKGEGAATYSRRAAYEGAEGKANTIKQDYEIGIIGKDEAEAALKEINAQLEKMGLKPIEIQIDTSEVETSVQRTQRATDAIGQMGSAINGLGSAIEMPVLNILGTIAQAVATMALGYAQATAGAAKMGPWAWVAFAATGLAQLTAMITAVKGATAMANGGVVSGPTLALVGEYGGARNNPEVVAPLDKLRSMIQPAGGVGGTVSFEIEGRKLVGVLNNETRIASKSGRR